MNIFLLLPLNKHPEYEMGYNGNNLLKLGSIAHSEDSKYITETGFPICSSIGSQEQGFDVQSISSSNNSSDSSFLTAHYSKLSAHNSKNGAWGISPSIRLIGKSEL